jgi:Na+-transporting NADH:ubiquinone oxidoreductase subunit B
MSQGKANAKVLRKQLAMRKVLAATVPCIFGGVYFFGWRVLASIAFCCGLGFLVEYAFCRKRGEPVTEAVFVTAVLFALIMPAGVAWHVMGVGIIFSVMFSKEVFGGFGKNIFNPALAGRCFVYICYPVAMTGRWGASMPLKGFGALGRWSVAGIDAVTSVTPMAVMKAGGDIPSLGELFFGGISGTVGVTSALLILIGGGYLFYKKIASRTTILSVIISYAVFNQILIFTGAANMSNVLTPLLGGGFLFGAFFMATDPISSPRTNEGKIFYGIIIALCAAVIRNFSIFNGGLMFSILLGNMFAPIIDYAVKEYKQKKKTALEGVK